MQSALTFKLLEFSSSRLAKGLGPFLRGGGGGGALEKGRVLFLVITSIFPVYVSAIDK